MRRFDFSCRRPWGSRTEEEDAEVGLLMWNRAGILQLPVTDSNSRNVAASQEADHPLRQRHTRLRPRLHNYPLQKLSQ
jgi:hypothetical protein